ncbi:MAG: DNA polymerase IV, partial [Saprospiraceae bacterium]|nr:DNA polymerase IV [Saprospiraceae bacterium]
MRRIIHIDMDAFYASVEQRDQPALRGRPVAVGGTGPRSVVAAASYEARAFGVRSAMPARRALDLCRDLVLVPPRFDVYQAVSQQIRDIFQKFTELVEPLSLDEAYLDISDRATDWPGAIATAREIKTMIRDATQLTASAGVSMNKFLAKLASDQDKPDGLTFIPPEEAPAFLEALPVEAFFGIGKATAEKMRLQGLATGADLKRLSEYEMIRRFGKQ